MKKESNVIVANTVERLKEYYPYDEESRTFTLPFHYEKLDDIIVDKHQVSKKPQVSYQLLSEIEEILHSIPSRYKADIEITIDDYQGYEPEVVMQSIKDTALAKQFGGGQQLKKDSIKAGILAVLGVFWIILSYAGQLFNWWGDPNSITSNAISGVLSIFAVIFYWEAVDMMIIHENKFIREFKHFLSKAKNIIIKDNNGKEIKEPIKNIGPAFNSYKTRVASEYITVLSSFIFFTFIMLRVIRYLGVLLLTHQEVAVYEMVISPVLLVLMCVTAVFGILIYRGYLRLLVPSMILTVLLLAVSSINLTFVLIHNEASELVVSAAAYLVIAVANIVGLVMRFCLTRLRKSF